MGEGRCTPGSSSVSIFLIMGVLVHFHAFCNGTDCFTYLYLGVWTKTTW